MSLTRLLLAFVRGWQRGNQRGWVGSNLQWLFHLSCAGMAALVVFAVVVAVT